MKKNNKLLSLFTVLLIFITVTAFSGCYLTSQLIPVPQITVSVPGPTFQSDSDYNQGALPTHVQFENTVAGKVWYTRLQDNGDYNRRSQTKLRFNTGSKTFTKETYYWERYGNTTTYSFAGTNVQTGRYYYTQNNNQLEYELIEDYNVNAYNSRRNNSIYRGLKSVWCGIDNAEMITWEGKQYISKQALANQSVVDYTNRRDIKLNY